MTNVNISFLISLLIISLGFIAKKTGLVKESDGEGISRIIFNFTLPSVVITAFSNIKIDSSLLLLPVFNIVFCLLMTGLALFVFRKHERKEKGMLTMLVPAFNIGLFAYPLVEMIWGTNGVKYFGMFDMGNAFMVFGTNYAIAAIYSSEKAKIDFRKLTGKVFSSIPFLTYIVTLTFTLTGISFPGFFLDLTKIISKANMPLSLLLLGIFLSFDFEAKMWKNMIKILLLRYVIGIAVGVILYFILPFEPMFKITLLLGFCLPISMAVIPYSVEFNYDSRFIGTINNATIIISFVLIWLVVSIIGV